MPMKPPRAERISIEGPAGAIQALIEIPEPVDPSHFAVVCHPHPLHGGTLDNKVVHTLARTFEQLGAPAIRFNFRGVGASAGSYDAGRGEAEDALAVIDYGRARWPGASLWLAGFSFGGSVAIRIASRANAAALVAVAPGVTNLDSPGPEGVLTRSSDWLIIQGDADEVLSAQEVLRWAAKVTPAPATSVLAGASHFFHGRLQELGERVREFLQGQAAT